MHMIQCDQYKRNYSWQNLNYVPRMLSQVGGQNALREIPVFTMLVFTSLLEKLIAFTLDPYKGLGTIDRESPL